MSYQKGEFSNKKGLSFGAKAIYKNGRVLKLINFPLINFQ